VLSRRNSKVSVKEHLDAIATGLKFLVKPNRMTVYYPEEVIDLSERYRGMIKYDWNKCISCGLCAMICPADAMKMYRKKGEKKARPGINYQRCIFCGFCVDICPTNALSFTKVHDIAYEKLEEMIIPPEKFTEDWVSPAEKEGAKKLKVEFDEERGLRHVPK